MFHFSNNWIINGKLTLAARIDVREDISLKTVLLSKKIPNTRNETNDATCMPLKVSVLYLENKNLLNICQNNEVIKYKLL